MGAVQKLATVVIIGLTGLATLLVFLLADEPGRRDEELTEQEDVAISRGIDTYIANCLVCHGPAGEGWEEVDADGNPLRAGKPIGGNTPERLLNQSDDPVIRADRENQIRTRIHGGFPIGCGTIYPSQQCSMPPWGQDFGGELNDEQIEELVLMIQHVDWDLVYNEAIEASGGYPTPPVTPEASPEGNGDGDGTPTVSLEAYDIGWRTAGQAGPSVDLTVAPGAVIEIVNVGASDHNFEATELGINETFGPGQTISITIPADAAPGTYDFICNIPGHAAAGMVGTLTVDPNAAAPPSEGSPPAEATPTEGGGAGEPPRVRLEGYDIGWRTADQAGPQVELTLAPGSVIELVNVGVADHNFEAAELGIDQDMPVGFSGEITIPADAAPGTYDFICNIPGHAQAGMVGTITIDPNAGGAGEPAGGEATPPTGESARASPPATPVGTPAAAPTEVTLDAWDIGWRLPDQPGPEIRFAIQAGGTLTIVNTGQQAHNFTAEQLGLTADPLPGETVTLTIPPDTPPGDYEFICAVPGHATAGMVGTISVVPPSDSGTPPVASPAASPEDGGTVETVHLEAYDIGWRTADQPGPRVNLTVAPGTTIEIVNTGVAGHNFDLEALGIFVDLPPGATMQVDIPADTPPGEYEFICSVPGHAPAGMVGTLTVQ